MTFGCAFILVHGAPGMLGVAWIHDEFFDSAAGGV
jgi:hypothetical protein